MGLLEAVILAVVQGLTEFLPVSSSGHLVLFSYILGVNQPSIAYEVLLHFGTLIAVFIAFWRDIVALFQAGLKIISNPKAFPRLIDEDADVRMLVALCIGTIPAVIVALLLESQIEGLFAAPGLTGIVLLITGGVLFITERYSKIIALKGKSLKESVSILDGLIIGIGQAFAIVPGLSRSGTTIGFGLWRGLRREEAARFSFLLSIPAILGATVLAIGDLISGQVNASISTLIIGTIVAAITGYVAIKFLLQIIKKGRLVYFSYYVWAVGLTIIFYFYFLAG
ncbi:MAG: undecaprenyl-diphosphate phosphatase [Firmicutes bacterium]|nr:undecaprenyl-diphosphate phosphatase [Bacillota bacterium]